MQPAPRGRPTAGRPVSTREAAAAVGRTPAEFRAWAHRQRLVPADRRRQGRSTFALWDLDEVLEAAAAGSRHADEDLDGDVIGLVGGIPYAGLQAEEVCPR